MAEFIDPVLGVAPQSSVNYNFNDSVSDVSLNWAIIPVINIAVTVSQNTILKGFVASVAGILTNITGGGIVFEIFKNGKSLVRFALNAADWNALYGNRVNWTEPLNSFIGTSLQRGDVYLLQLTSLNPATMLVERASINLLGDFLN